MDLGLRDKTALVLASSKGIGRAAAAALAREGCRVLISSSKKENLEKARSEIRKETGALPEAYVLDVGSPRSIEETGREILAKHRLDILITNSPGPETAEAAGLTDDQVRGALQRNCLSVIQLCRLFLPGMIERRFGRVINLSSTTAREPDTGMALSNMTRAAVLAYCKTLSREIAHHGVTVNSILTGGVLTERLIDLRRKRSEKTGLSMEDLAAQAAKNFPVGFVATPEQFVPVLVFLASPLSLYVNGVGLPVDGGFTRSL